MDRRNESGVRIGARRKQEVAEDPQTSWGFDGRSYLNFLGLSCAGASPDIGAMGAFHPQPFVSICYPTLSFLIQELPNQAVTCALCEDGPGWGEGGGERDKAGAQISPWVPPSCHIHIWNCHVHIWSCLLPPFPGLPEEGIAHWYETRGKAMTKQMSETL